MFPSRSSHQHGPPLLGRVRLPAVPQRHRSYSALRLPALHRALAVVPLARAYLHDQSLFLAGQRMLWQTRSRRDWSPVPSIPVVFVKERQGLPDDWPIFLGTCRSRTPRRLHWLLDPFDSVGDSAAAFQRHEALGTGMSVISRLHSHGPHLRVPTYRRRGCPRRRKAHYRPAGLGFGRTGFAPAGRELRILESRRRPPSFRTSLSWSLP